MTVDPTLDTMDEFLKLVSGKNCHTIVCLNKQYLEIGNDEKYIPTKTGASITLQNDNIHIKVTNLNSTLLNKANIIKNELEIVQNRVLICMNLSFYC
jgi:hypothetical protein